MNGSRSRDRCSEPSGERRAASRDRRPPPPASLIDEVRFLQSQAGNAAVAAALARPSASSLLRQHAAAAGAGASPDAGAAAPPDGPASLEEFRTAGTSLNNQQLGFKAVFTYWVNGVELRFLLGAAAQQYRDIRPRQYSGPEAVWIKRGNPIDTAWISLSQGPGTGWDDPLPPSVTRQPNRIAYFDSPGPNLGPMVAARQGRPSRVYVVQNFTGWLEGAPNAGGGAQRISPVIPWYSRLSVWDQNWNDANQPPQYIELESQTEAARGWKPTTAPAI